MTSITVVFSHLRWDFVYQRPQHILSRMAQEREVLYVEEPVRTDGPPWLERIPVAPRVTVLRVHTQDEAPGFHDDQIPTMRRLLEPDFASLHGVVAWFYTPMALPLLADLDTSTIVYDCMDELSAFSGAPKQLKQRERALMRAADLVFAGGASLFEAKAALHRSIHCFPSSVDAHHFRPAPSASAAGTYAPRLGYFGVIDERFDFELLRALAAAEPDWRFEIVGPVAKVDPAVLPRCANVVYPGFVAYEDLPALVATWDVCLMPFARNESTRFISPTKVLEYLAAEKPVVSTAIRDVAVPYAHVVEVCDAPDAFIAACRRVLAESSVVRERRVAASRTIVAATSWDTTVARMLAMIDASAHCVDADGLARGKASLLAHVVRLPVTPHVEAVSTAVIGAGPTGLSALYHLDDDAKLFERGPTVGGWCRSVVDQGFTFDHAGHIMFSNDPVVLAMYEVLLGTNLHWQNREAWIHTDGVYTRYPFQGALHGLPPDVLKECLVGAIEARFGPLSAAATTCTVVAGKAANEEVVLADDLVSDDCCGDGEHVRPDTSAQANTPNGSTASDAPANFEEFILRTWGSGVAKHFALPYNRKLWALPLTEMETSWLGGRVPLPDLAEMIEGAVQPAKKPVGPNARFGYPLRGGFQALMDGFLPHLAGRLECNADVVEIDVGRHELQLADGRRYAYDRLVSTMPLPKLIALLGDAAPAVVHAAAAGLRHVSVRCVNLGVAREAISEKHWIYYPGPTVFHRIFLQGNTSPHCNPPGGFGLTCEITYGPLKPLPCEGEALIQRCFDDCVSVGLLRADDRLLTANTVDMDYAYVVYDHARTQNVRVIRDFLRTHDIALAGRYSEWEYYNSDHAFIAGRRAAMDARFDESQAALA